MPDLASLQVTVSGRVQGVFFRAFTARCARELKLAGYVCNLPGGAVEIRAEGERHLLEKLVDYLNEGPPAARVDKVTVNWLEYTGDYSGFNVRH